MKIHFVPLLMLCACASFPEVDAAENGLGTTGTAPLLLPTDQLAKTSSASSAQAAGTALNARAAQLRLRGQQAMANTP